MFSEICSTEIDRPQLQTVHSVPNFQRYTFRDQKQKQYINNSSHKISGTFIQSPVLKYYRLSQFLRI